MKTRRTVFKLWWRLLSVAALFVLGAGAVFAQAHDGLAVPEQQYGPGDPATDEGSPAFARVRYIDGGGKVIRHGGYEEDLRANSPLYVGDRIETVSGQRLEVQLPDGSLIRLDEVSRLDIYDLATGGGAEEATLLGLGAGSLQASVPEPQGGEGFRIDTPAASIYPAAASALRVDVETGDAVRVSLARGRVEVVGKDNKVVLRSGERTRVEPNTPPRTPWAYNTLSHDVFDGWVADREGAYYARTSPGKEYEDLPAPVQPYYGELSRYGQWVWTDEYGWTWKPSDVAPDWQPYLDGSWTYGPYGPTWVGYEPWGWAPYHYGRWDFSIGIGWFWIPGWSFAPAWTYWYYGPSYVGWCPLGYWNYPVWVGVSWWWGYPWFAGSPWTFMHYDDFYHHDCHHNYVPRSEVVGSHLREGVVGPHAVNDPPAITRSGGRQRQGDALPADAYARARDRASKGRGFEDVGSVRNHPPARDQRGRPEGVTKSFRDRERQTTQRPGAGRPGGQAGATPRTSPGGRGGAGSGSRPPASPGRGGGPPRGGAPSTRPPSLDDRPVVQSGAGGRQAPSLNQARPSTTTSELAQGGLTGLESGRLPSFSRNERSANRGTPRWSGAPDGVAPDGAGVRRLFGRIANDDRGAARVDERRPSNQGPSNQPPSNRGANNGSSAPSRQSGPAREAAPRYTPAPSSQSGAHGRSRGNTSANREAPRNSSPGAQSRGYGRPAAPEYSSAARDVPRYSAPTPQGRGYSQSAPRGYSSPGGGYGSPAPRYQAPSRPSAPSGPSYSAPSRSAPAPSYSAPSRSAPAPSHSAPAPSHSAPSGGGHGGHGGRGGGGGRR